MSSEDSDEDERDANDLFWMGLLDTSSLEVSEGMGLSNTYMKSQITIYSNNQATHLVGSCNWGFHLNHHHPIGRRLD
jgi:hypothetical protein